jgi:hypothetical protein
MVPTKTLRQAAEAMKETGRRNPGLKEMFDMAAEYLDMSACEIDRLKEKLPPTPATKARRLRAAQALQRHTNPGGPTSA